MKSFLFFILLLLAPALLSAQPGYIEVLAPGSRQLKLVVETPRSIGSSPAPSTTTEMGEVLTFDITMSGIAVAETRQTPAAATLSLAETDLLPWLNAGCDLLVRSEYSIRGDDLTVEFRLFDVPNHKLMTAKRYLGKAKDLRRFAHSFADEILLTLTGEKGCFTTHIAFVSNRTGNKEIAIMDWDGHKPLQLTRNGSINLNPDFSPDGRELIYTSYKRNNADLYKRSLSSTAEIPVSSRGGLNITGSWSPDGSRIALALSKDGNSEIYTIGRDGSGPTRLTVNEAIDVSPAWSPNGSQIAFVSDRHGKPQIFVMNSNGGNIRRLTGSGSYNVNPRWSPKGDKIAYARMQGSGFQIYTINADGSGDTQLTSEGSNENPAWSPDARFIAFSSRRGGPEAIYVMRADGAAQTRVSQGKSRSTQPAWQPR